MKKIFLITTACIIISLIIIGFWWMSTKRESQISPEVIVENKEGASNPTAKLEIFAGTVWVVLPGNSEKNEAADGQKIVAGTKIITGLGSRAQILYPNHAVTRLDFDTEIIVEEFQVDPSVIKVKLEKKRIWSRIPKLLGKESYQSVSNTVVATVRGTSYGHGILPDGRNKVTSVKGTVEAGCTDENLANNITADHKIFFNCQKDNEIEEGLVDDKDKDEWFEFNQKEDKKLDERFGPDTYGD